MMEIMDMEITGPVISKERFVILDALRGLALLGICLANFPEFSLYTFLKGDVTDGISTAGIDRMVRYLQFVFIDGKFYTLFSVLFGVGFSIIIANLARKGDSGFRFFYRRMGVLFLIGFLHLMFIWSGDILVLYALLGLFLLGFYVGRNRIYANLAGHGRLLKQVVAYGTLIGLPVSLAFAWSSLNGHSWGLAVHSVLYTFSVFPLGLASAFCLWYVHHRENPVFKILAAPGRMALSNYIGQSLWGMFIFYGIGL